MKKSIFTRLFVLLCVMLMQGAQSWADTDGSTITVSAPTITPGSQTYNGTIVPVITADEGCSIVYVKSTTKDYTTVADIDKNQGIKTVSSNSVTITDIVGKVGDRHISAYATKTVNGKRYCSAVTNVTYTYAASTKSDITLSASLSGTLSMEQPSQTATISVTASDSKEATTITGLTYTYEVSPAGIVVVDANGTVTPKKAGTASVNVIFAGNDSYNAASCVIDVNVASNASSTEKVFYSIADIRQAAQSTTDHKNENCALIFKEDNPATVIAVFTKSDPDIDGTNTTTSKAINSFFIIDSSNKGLWIPANNIIVPSDKQLSVGSKFTGTLVGSYKQITSMLPSFTDLKNSKEINGTTYTTSITVDNSGIATDDTPAIYPYTAIEDVQTLASTNETVKDGDITTSSYGSYLNTIVKLPGTIKASVKQNSTEYYLVQAENTQTSSTTNRIYFNSSQIDGINLSEYVGTTGVFEGILIKRNNSEPKLVVLKSDFFDISKIYLDENDTEERITDLVKQGAFDDEVDVYIHRTKLVNTTAWNTLCFPFDMTKDEFKEAFGCELTNLASPATDTEMTLHQWEGKVSTDGVLQFTQLTGDNMKITAGVPYLMKASGTQTVCTQTIKDADTKTPQELMTTDNTYYAHIGQKLINVVPPHEIKATYNNSIVKGDFYFRGLYGRKKYTEDSKGKLTTTLIADGGSQKYQYISTSAGNYLKYLPSGSTLQFNGMRAYFYFPNWDKEANNKIQPSGNTTNAKIHIMVIDEETTGIKNAGQANTPEEETLYNLAGQKVDRSYRGIVIKNGKKYLNK